MRVIKSYQLSFLLRRLMFCTAFVCLVSCGFFPFLGTSKESCDTSYKSTIIDMNVSGGPGSFKAMIKSLDNYGDGSRNADETCHTGFVSRARDSSESFELNICIPPKNADDNYELQTSQQILGVEFSLPDDSWAVVQEKFGQIHSNEWRGFKALYNDRAGSYYSSNVDQNDLEKCSSKFIQ